MSTMSIRSGRRAALAIVLAAASCRQATEDPSGARVPVPVPNGPQRFTPAHARAAEIRAVQMRARADYGIESTRRALEVRVGPGPRRVAVSFDAAGVAVGPHVGSWRLRLGPGRIGRGPQVETPSGVAPRASGNRVSYPRGSVEEWYLAGPLGLEHGFDVSTRPAGAPGEAVRIELPVQGVSPEPRGSTVDLVRPSDRARVATYGSLFVTGARGDAVPASMGVEGGSIVIRIDDAAATYPITVDPLLFIREQVLVPNDAATTDSCGASVAVSGDTMVVGCSGDDSLVDAKGGAAYVFVRDALGVWTQQAKLVPADGFESDLFGAAVAIEGSTIVVGAPAADGVASGAAYVFVKVGLQWTQTAKVVSTLPGPGDSFGAAVRLSGTTMAVGAPDRTPDGSVFVFVKSGPTWTQQAEIAVPDTGAIPIPLQTGKRIALEGDRLVFSSMIFPSPHTYVYERSGGVWQQSADIADAAGPVDLAGNRLVSGLMGSAVRTFEWTGLDWAETALLGLPAFTNASSVSLLGDTVAVGVSADVITSGFLNEGTVRVFRHDGATWNTAEVLMAEPAVNQGYFGASVDLGPTTLLVGANGAAGAAYAFALKLSNGSPCQDGSECEDGFCVDGSCCNWSCGGGDLSDCMACSVAAGGATDGTCAALLAGTICHSATGSCDPAEVCDGSFFACPADAHTANGTPCDDGDPCTVGDACVAGACGPGPDMCGSGGAGGSGGFGGGMGGNGEGGFAGAGQGAAGAGGEAGPGGAGGAVTPATGGGGTGGAVGPGASGGGGGSAAGGSSAGGGRSLDEPPLVPVDTGCGCRLRAPEDGMKPALWIALAIAAWRVARRPRRAGRRSAAAAQGAGT